MSANVSPSRHSLTPGRSKCNICKFYIPIQVRGPRGEILNAGAEIQAEILLEIRDPKFHFSNYFRKIKRSCKILVRSCEIFVKS